MVVGCWSSECRFAPTQNTYLALHTPAFECPLSADTSLPTRQSVPRSSDTPTQSSTTFQWVKQPMKPQYRFIDQSYSLTAQSLPTSQPVDLQNQTNQTKRQSQRKQGKQTKNTENDVCFLLTCSVKHFDTAYLFPYTRQYVCTVHFMSTLHLYSFSDADFLCFLRDEKNEFDFVTDLVFVF